MSKLETSQNDKIFFKVIDGMLRRSVPMMTEGAEKREYKGKVYNEIPYNSIIGKITGIEFKNWEYEGKKINSLEITLDENEDGKKPVISVGLETKYGMDFMHKLPNVDLEEEVRIRPYSFLPEGEDKEVTGIEILQQSQTGNFDKKISSYFFKKQGEKSIAVNGFPVRENPYDEQSDEERDIYKIKRKGFLVNYMKENVIPKLGEEIVQEKDPLEDELDPSQIPF